MAYNIQMNYFDGSNYQELNPVTLLANVTDWQNSIYSKTEVDNTVSGINTTISGIVEILTYNGAGSYGADNPSNLIFSKKNPKYVIIQNTVEATKGNILFFNITGLDNTFLKRYGYGGLNENAGIQQSNCYAVYDNINNKLSWYSRDSQFEQANGYDTTYKVIVFY